AQLGPHVTPPGVLVTVPSPVPDLLTARVTVWMSKVAVTVVAAVRVTVHEPMPAQPPPLQPVKTEPAVGVAVRVTAVPLAHGPAQSVPQLIPAGVLVTVPVPALVTVRVKVGVKVAVTEVAAVNVTVHEPMPAQPPPLQPVKTEPAVGVAVSVTAVPLA